ncbi:GNAT family N-acetyltransferase [Goodfellowiella coeruleoviolacea]|uniref:BioF2-like acetyltransferase domain-containing protein n=1 Tax=Goodfellowiella coeruleoviolacea TaxID=334858 RepID=A0AAE3GJQ4_9PSEU|nr:GNAT family N-acetyltransferase [Goodfellowiella coeruleoviolacea]MCP2169516.1 hypothetical protein [Goodfellowiella coeruleoviolacea]
MNLTVTVHDPRVDPEPEGWPEFRAAQRLPVPWDYGLMGVESAAARSPNLLAVVRRGARVVTAVAATIARPGLGRPDAPGPVGGPARWGPRWVEVHQPWLSGFPGWACAEDLAPAARRQALRAAERAVCRFVGVGCLGVLYRYVPPADAPLLAGAGRLVRPAAGTAVLDNAFGSVAEWISSLSRGRRHSIRGQIRKIAADPDLVVRFAPERDDLSGAELAGLLRRHRAKFGRVRFDWRSPVCPDYLHALVRRPDVVTGTYHDRAGRLLAFTVILDHPETPLHQHWAALAPHEGGRQHLYFDAFARVVGHMVEHGRRSVSSGRGLGEVKASLGFTLRPLCVVAAPRPVCG